MFSSLSSSKSFSSDRPENKSSTLPKEDDGSEIKHVQHPFKNWGGSVESSPAYTFFPKTKVAIKNIVTWTRSIGKKLRVSGYKHTWNHFFPHDGDILISLKSPEGLVTPTKLDKNNELEHIELIGEKFVENGQIKHLCKIGSATSNQQFRAWAVESFFSGKDPSWTIPLNVILVENTFGGTNALMCHGAGLGNKTLSDLVTEIEFVNAKGELQTIGYKINEPEEKQYEGKQLIKSAAGAFGLLGPVTAITLKLDLMTHAKMHAVAPRLALTVPPPPGYVISKHVPAEVMKGVTRDQIQHAQEEFIFRCENHYYSEWFWFSLHTHGWVNTFENNGLPEKSKPFPGKINATLQEIENYIAGVANKSVMHLLPPKVQACVLSEAAMLLLPADKEDIMPLPDALHFRRGIDEMQVDDMEWEIPIPLLPNGKLDWSICQRAWWDAIVTVYEWLAKYGKVPMRLPLEMRVMGGSEMTMAPQKGNAATCAIEVLTVGENLVAKQEWLAFMQAITDKWSSYTDYTGKPLNARPHWAKQSVGLTVQRKGEVRKEIWNYLKEDAYREELPVFHRDLAAIAKKGNYSVEDLKMFSNPLLDHLFFDAKKPAISSSENKDLTPPKPTSSSVALSSGKLSEENKTAVAHLFRLRRNALDACAEDKHSKNKASLHKLGLLNVFAEDAKKLGSEVKNELAQSDKNKKKKKYCCF